MPVMIATDRYLFVEPGDVLEGDNIITDGNVIEWWNRRMTDLIENGPEAEAAQARECRRTETRTVLVRRRISETPR